jgi:hypothetical protein
MLRWSCHRDLSVQVTVAMLAMLAMRWHDCCCATCRSVPAGDVGRHDRACGTV